ncbi:MAG: magnesium transporter [Planctomycetota bacterium]
MGEEGVDTGERTRAEVAGWIEAGDSAALADWLEVDDHAGVVRLLAHLEDSGREQLLALLAPEQAAYVLEIMPAPQAVGALGELEPDAAARIIEELPSDEQADFIGELAPDDAEAILAELPDEEAEEVRRLAAYEDSEAGGIMVTEFLAYPEDSTVADVLSDLLNNADEYRKYDIQYAYVVDADERLLGVLPLRDLLLARRSQAVVEGMITAPVAVTDHRPLVEVAATFRQHDYLGLPVVDEGRRLVGVVQRSDLEHALVEEADETYRSSQGIVGGEELRSMPLLVRSRRRLSWLSVNVLLNVVAASVIAANQETLEAVIALAVFLPIISDMSGCSGNQAVAVSMRELALGVVRPADLMRVLGKEASIGVINGLVLGGLIGGVAWLWKGNPYLGLVVGVALALNTLLAVSVGGAVPLLLKRMGQDPAVAAGPLLTTVTDMCGFFLVLSLANAMIGYLA